jgi:RNA polymerase sigma-70 factor (ECF subfamily)
MSAGASEFWSIIEPELGWLHRQLRRLGVPEADLEDLCQDVCIRVYGAWSQRDATKPIRPWLFAFVFRVAADHRRRARNQRPHDASTAELVDERAPSPEGHASAEQDRAVLLTALRALPDRHREVVILVELEQYSVAEAADILGVSESAARERARKARVQLAAELRRMLAERPTR